MTPGKHYDGNGLFLVVDHHCAKRWVLRTVVAGKRRDIGLGSAALVSLADARREAARLRGIARAGGDPLAQLRTERKTVPTFEEAARQVHKEHSPAWKNKKHRAEWLSSLETHVFPVLRDLRVDKLGTPDVLKALTPVWLTKPETARRLKQRIRLVMSWAKASGFVSGDNPCDGLGAVLPAQKDTPEHHASMPYADIPAFIVHLRKTGSALPVTKLALEFLILTACRTSEVLGATWDEINLGAKVWTIAAGRMKAGREHRVPLSPRCIEILTQAKDLCTRGNFVFGNPVNGEQLSKQTLLMVMRRMKLTWVPHGFRSSFRTWASEKTNAPHAVMEAALAHTEHDKTVAAYARSDLFDRRAKLMEKWAQHCTAVKATVTAIGRTA